MILLLESLILSIMFSLAIFVPLYKNPIGQIMSYPTKIRQRVESLPQYKDNIKQKEKKHLSIKIIFVFVIALVLGIIAYLSGAKTFIQVFKHVFILFFAVNLYDLLVMELLVFRNVKKFRIPGTEDMETEYKSPKYHIIGFFIGIGIGTIVSFLSATYMYIFNYIM